MLMFDFNLEASLAFLFLSYLNLVQSLLCSEQEKIVVNLSNIIYLRAIFNLYVLCLTLSLQVNDLNIPVHLNTQKDRVI